MKVAYFDCYSGISGDMTLAALVDLGADLKKIKSGLASLDLKGYEIKSSKVKRGMFGALKIDVAVKKSAKKHSHTHTHSHSRNFTQIKKLIQSSKISKAVKDNAIEIFHQLGKAEARVHRSTIDKVHFHEVGAVDSIVDIVGSALAFELLGIDKVYASPLNMGGGVVECEHGILPVPAPATLELLKGVPCFSSGVDKELTTPTGAAIIKNYAESFGPIPQMKILKTGYGAGDHIIKENPNMLRVILGEVESVRNSKITVIETNIDDMNPEFYDHVMDSLFAAGAVDVFFTPIVMKKSRPAIKLSVLVPGKKLDPVTRVLLTETSTFGIRSYEADRVVLEREHQTVKTRYGNIKVKVGKLDGAVLHFAPEYDDCRKIAKKKKVPIKKVYDEAVRAAEKKLKEV